ncbi:cation-translocating P-type ATPase [Nocardioides sp. W3-2-3]|nr:cation-translocating P-type ATPase [Nocardioides convexus]
MPVETTTGAAVYGGTLNGDGLLRIKVTTAYTDTVLPRVIRQVEEAQASRGRAQRFAERFGAIYTPAMFALAAAVALLGPLTGLTFTEAVYRALVILTVSCSCALVISVPVTVVTAIARGARDGILIKGGAHLEQLARLDTIAFDKTGTLTAGRPALTAIHALVGHTEQDVLTLAAAVEANSTHPIATAIVDAAQKRRLALPQAREASTIPGIGAHATIDGHTVHVGRIREAATDDPPTAPVLEAIEGQGLTPVGVYRDNTLIGVLGVADQLRPEAIAALTQAEATGHRPHRHAHRRQPPRRRGGRHPGWASTRSTPLCCPTARPAKSKPCASTARSRWSATASTTPPRWPTHTSPSPWAPPAPTSPSKPPMSHSWPTT